MPFAAALRAQDYAGVTAALERGDLWDGDRLPLEIAIEELRDERMVAILLKYRATPRTSRLNLLQVAVSTEQWGVETLLKPFYSSSERCMIQYYS
jgi:hypothetical protein